MLIKIIWIQVILFGLYAYNANAAQLKVGLKGTTAGVLKSLPSGEIQTVGVFDGTSNTKFIVIDDRKETKTVCYDNNKPIECSELGNEGLGYKERKIKVDWINKKYWDGNIHPIAVKVELNNKTMEKHVTIGVVDGFVLGEGCILEMKDSNKQQLRLHFCSHGQKDIPGIKKLESMKNGVRGTRVKVTWHNDNGEVFGDIASVLDYLEIIPSKK